ncbi:MAG: DUF5800 family protein [Halobacteria archaeon]
MTEVEIEGTKLDFKKEGIDVEYEGHDFRLRKKVVEEATGKQYRDATDHDVMRMIDRSVEFNSGARRIGDIL